MTRLRLRSSRILGESVKHQLLVDSQGTPKNISVVLTSQNVTLQVLNDKVHCVKCSAPGVIPRLSLELTE